MAAVWLGAAFVAVAAVTDAVGYKVYNWLTVPAMIVGLALGLVEGGPSGLGRAAVGLAVGVAALIIPWALGWVGGGDMKLLAAVGALAGWRAAVGTLMAGTVLGGVAGVLILALTAGRRFTHAVTSVALSAGAVPIREALQNVGEALQIRLPYAVFLAAGYGLYTFGGGRGWW